MPRWKSRSGEFRNVSARDFRRNCFLEVCIHDWQAGEESWDELEERDRVLSSELTEKEVMGYAVQR